MDKKWYAVYTKPRWEKKVAEVLTQRQIESYCPINKVLSQWSDRKKLVYEPLFKSYVFVHVSDEQLVELTKIPGIINLVYWLAKPAVIKDAEIEAIRLFLSEHNYVKKEQAIHINDAIIISRGSLINQKGTVVAIKNNYVTVELPSLGYVLYAELTKSSIKKTKEAELVN